MGWFDRLEALRTLTAYTTALAEVYRWSNVCFAIHVVNFMLLTVAATDSYKRHSKQQQEDREMTPDTHVERTLARIVQLRERSERKLRVIPETPGEQEFRRAFWDDMEHLARAVRRVEVCWVVGTESWPLRVQEETDEQPK